MKPLFLISIFYILFSCKPIYQKNQLPNILIFLGDDMNWNDCQPYGNKIVKTPNIEKLANEGICFDNMFTSTAMCAPSRQQLMTGLYPVRSGAFPNHSNVFDGVKSFAHHFKNLGYEVALIGKKHYGPKDSFPINYLGGVQHDTGFSGSDIDLNKIKPVINGNKPFFLIVAQNQPHTPWNRGEFELYPPQTLEVPEYMVDTDITRKGLSSYYSEITYMDSLLGKTLKIINDSSKTQNTISIFTSEQGYFYPFGKWTCYDLGLKTAFIVKWPGKIKPKTRTSAITQYVDIIPTLIDAVGQDPSKINVGISDSKGLTGFDGKSFLDVMIGEDNYHRDYTYGVQTTRGIINGSESYPIRSIRSEKYKYILNLNYDEKFYNILTAEDSIRPSFLRGEKIPPMEIYKSWVNNAKTEKQLRWVKTYLQRPFEELYDLKNDPYEKNNIANQPGFEEVKKQMKNKLKDWMMQQGDMGVETEMKAISRQDRTGKGPWLPYLTKNQKLNR